MPDKREKVIEILAQHGELSMVKLVEKTGIRRNDLFELVPKMESEKLVIATTAGREKLVSLSSPNKTVNSFINTFEKRLDNYEKEINKHLNGLKKNLPLVSPMKPMTKIKMKTAVLELDKEKRVYREMGKTEDSYGYTWKTRPKPRKHFDQLLHLLNRLYQESSVLNFAEPIADDSTLIKGWQKKSERLLRHSIKKVENMTRNDDIRSFHFVIHQLQNVMYGMIFKTTLEKQIKSE